MRSAAESTNVAAGRHSNAAGGRFLDLLDQVDYRLARRRRKRKRSTTFATGPICARVRSGPPPTSAWSISSTTLPTPGHSASIFNGELYSSIRVSVLTSEWRMSPSVELFGDVLHPKLDEGQIFIDSTRFVADPDKARNFPELPYVTVQAGFDGRRLFPCRLRTGHRSSRASGVLSPRVSAGDLVRAAIVPGPRQAGRIDGGAFADGARKGLGPLSVPAFERFRTADVVRAPRRAPFFAAIRSSAPFERASIVPQS